MSFCSQCGAQNADGAKFCGKCGAALPPAPAGEPTWRPTPGQSAPPQGQAWNAQPTGQQTWQTGSATQQQWTGQRPGMAKAKQPRGWLGLFGAILAFISTMALKSIVNDYGYGFTYMDLFKVGEMIGSEEFKSLIAVSFALVVAAAVLYVLSKNMAGLIVSIISLILFFITLNGLSEGMGASLFSVVGIGFWLILIGHIAMILSMPLKNVNESINNAFSKNKN